MPDLTSELPFNDTVGESIPPDTPHAVSVSLPTWRSNVGYEEGEKWVVDKMQCGYPRFFIHKTIQRLARAIVEQFGSPDQDLAMLFPTISCAKRCVGFLGRCNPSVDPRGFRIREFVPAQPHTTQYVQPRLSCVLYPSELWPTAKAFWQHTGEGIQSRRAEFCLQALENQTMVESSTIPVSITPIAKGPKRYQMKSVDHSVSKTGINGTKEGTTGANGVGVPDSALFVEERFGRNLDVVFAYQAKLAIRKRIAGSLTNTAELPDSLEVADDLVRTRSRDIPGFTANDIYLYPCGMNAIFHAHVALLSIVGEQKSIMYGFPYVDTLKVLEKFGPGAVFYGHGNGDDLDHLEQRLKNGERFLSLFCEFPGNPLLKTPNLQRIRALADEYGFAVVIDETIGNFLNVHVLPYADMIVSSLTKIFSGDSNVMGGAMMLNPRSRYYDTLKTYQAEHYEDNQFEEDSIYMERNSRDFVNRIQRVNRNAELIADILREHPAVKQVNYPKYSDTKPFYDFCRLPEGGYGGLLSAVFHRLDDAKIFYDHLDTHKGPSLGTNFTLSSPFVLLAHYGELEWAAQYGCEISLVRFSVGLEDENKLRATFEYALSAIPK